MSTPPPSPKSDDYARLRAPWKPMTNVTIKHIPSLYTKVKIDYNTKEVDRAKTENIGAVMNPDDYGQDGKLKLSRLDSINANNVINNKTQDDSDKEDLGVIEIDNSEVDRATPDSAQINGAEVTDTDNDESQHIDTKCVAVSTCVANSGDHRKVVSHIFGRNKKCTRGLPNNLWILWCRKHYQRFKYRAEEAENWHVIQLGLVRKQLQTFEDWGEVRSWNIELRKAERVAIVKENKNGVTYTNYLSSCWERFLVPHLGLNQTFAHVRHILDVIEGKFNEAEYRNRDKKLKAFPGVEFLPNVQKAKDVKKPPVKKGEVAYKKITLDQPAFVGRNGANKQYLEEVAAKKREASSTSQSSGTASRKELSPDTDKVLNASATKKRKTSATDDLTDNPAGSKHESPNNNITTTPPRKGPATKRKSTTPIRVTPPNSQDKSLPTKRKSMTPSHTSPLTDHDEGQPNKRRRLTRGYEKHGSDSEDTILTEKAKETGEKEPQKVEDGMLD